MRHVFSKKAAAMILAAAVAASGYTGAGYVLAQETETEMTLAGTETTEAPETPAAEQTETAAEPVTEATTEAVPVETTSEAATEETEALTEETTEETTEGTTEAATEETTSGEDTEETTAALEENTEETTEGTTEETSEGASEETTEEASYKTDFTFENSEVVIVAKVSAEAKLPENAELHVEKLLPGSQKYEQARQASIRDLGTAKDAEYNFYDVEFYADGEKIEVADGLTSVQMTFKTLKVSGTAGAEMALHIEETGSGVAAENVTASTGTGSNVASVGFCF